MNIKITQEHIDKGCKGSVISCPIALAVKDLGHCDVSVTPTHVTIFTDFDPSPEWFALPIKAVEFIKSFDKGRPVEPFEFTISNIH